MKQRRYIVTIEAYIWAESDAEAKSLAGNIADMLPSESDASVVSVVHNEFGSLIFKNL